MRRNFILVGLLLGAFVSLQRTAEAECKLRSHKIIGVNGKLFVTKIICNGTVEETAVLKYIYSEEYEGKYLISFCYTPEDTYGFEDDYVAVCRKTDITLRRWPNLQRNNSHIVEQFLDDVKDVHKIIEMQCKSIGEANLDAWRDRLSVLNSSGSSKVHGVDPYTKLLNTQNNIRNIKDVSCQFKQNNSSPNVRNTKYKSVVNCYCTFGFELNGRWRGGKIENW